MSTSTSSKERLDQALVISQLCPSRLQAKRLILAGEVRVDSTPGQGTRVTLVLPLAT